jgi:diguanylate cyclase (GGDEF)-like protein
VDKFQEINDALGHMIGDELLKTVGNILSEFMKPENCLSRYGGDEFSVIIKSDPSQGNFLDIFPLLMEISELFSKPVTVMDNQIYTSISMGVSIYPDDGEDPSTLVQNADRAMYYSKQKEYNSFTFYKSEMNKQTSVKRDIVHSLRRAIENNEFTLVYQPKIDLRNGKVSGAEALIRWNSNGTWISPMDFIPAAEESGLIIPIGKWVLERAARDTKYIHDRGYHNFRMSVNISARQFHVPGIGKFILDLLTLNDLSPDMFEVEITEGVAMKNVNLSEIILRELDSRGVKISIDDFGTGHSSLAYLKKFPIDILKIDKTFIKDIPHDKESCAIVNAVLSMSHELDIEVVAEGVEENDQLEFLRNGGCEYIQGFYYSKPVPLNTLEIFLEKHNN